MTLNSLFLFGVLHVTCNIYVSFLFMGLSFHDEEYQLIFLSPFFSFSHFGKPYVMQKKSYIKPYLKMDNK